MRADSSSPMLLSATDLTNHLACAHLTEQMRAVALGERTRPRPLHDAHAELARERGMLHEQTQFEALAEAVEGDYVDLGRGGPARTLAELNAADGQTREAMERGAALIYQATLVYGRWEGRPDFLLRVPERSALGRFAYRVLDTKLARSPRPHHVHQLCLYTRLVGEAQGRELDAAELVLGEGTRERIEVWRYRALSRRAASRVEEAVDGGPRDTYPEPVPHCGICRLRGECTARRRADDHLSLVAGARRDQRRKLVAAEITTLSALAEVTPERSVPDLAPERVELLHHQALLQRNRRSGLEPVYRHLPPAAGRGYASLPAPTDGDVYFDLEGDPFVGTRGGLEYLWGWVTSDGYESVWAHDAEGEREALERFVAFVEDRRSRYPDLRVYHYAAHEATTLPSLALAYGTCESEIDDWLRRGLLVDVYRVVRQALQVGEESYSLKALEPHHGFVRQEHTVKGGGGSIVAYETWLRTGDAGRLEAIREYNREDCESTRSLHRWLYEVMRPEAEREFAVDFSALVPEPPTDFARPPWLADVEGLVERLHDGLPPDSGADDPGQAERRLLGHLLLYHHRENKPQWWRYFDLSAK